MYMSSVCWSLFKWGCKMRCTDTDVQMKTQRTAEQPLFIYCHISLSDQFQTLHNWKKPADRNQLKLFLGFDLSPDKLRVSEGVIEWKVGEDGSELSQSHFMIAALVMRWAWLLLCCSQKY